MDVDRHYIGYVTATTSLYGVHNVITYDPPYRGQTFDPSGEVIKTQHINMFTGLVVCVLRFITSPLGWAVGLRSL